MFENRNYLIIKTEELSKVDFSQVLETSADTVRKSIDEVYTFVKWTGSEPSFVSSLNYTDGPHTHSEILTILSGEDWTDNTQQV